MFGLWMSFSNFMPWQLGCCATFHLMVSKKTRNCSVLSAWKCIFTILVIMLERFKGNEFGNLF